jgi:hypothetical protein
VADLQRVAGKDPKVVHRVLGRGSGQILQRLFVKQFVMLKTFFA